MRKLFLCLGISLVAGGIMLVTNVAQASSATTTECVSDECSEAMSKLVRYSLNGSPDAQVIVALAYATGDGVPRDVTLARQHLKRGLRNNDKRAWHIYSRWLREGFAFEMDVTAADKALDRAIRQDYAPALYERAVRQFDEASSNNQSSVDDLERAAEQLHLPSMYLLAQIKAAGLGVAVDRDYAAQLYAYLAQRNYLQSRQHLTELVGEQAIEQQTEQLTADLATTMAARHRVNQERAMEVITVSATRIGTEDFVIDLVEQLDNLRTFDGRSTGSNIRGQVCGRGVANCRVIYNAVAGTVSIGGTVRDAVYGIGW